MNAAIDTMRGFHPRNAPAQLTRPQGVTPVYAAWRSAHNAPYYPAMRVCFSKRSARPGGLPMLPLRGFHPRNAPAGGPRPPGPPSKQAPKGDRA